MFVTRAALLIVVTFAVYSFMLSSWFKTMDDQFSIVSNQTIRHSSQWPQLFKEGYFRDHSYYRPMTNLSYAFEFKAFGLDPFYYNLDNVLIHIANVLLVWAVAAVLVNVEAGFWTALLFAIHPVQWEAVANISGRAILLSAFFSLSSFLFFTKNKLLPSLALFAVGLLCKESTGIMPGIMLVYALCYKRRVWPILWFLPIIAAYVFLRHNLGITEVFAWRNINEGTVGFVTFLRSVITDLRILILPIDMHFDRSLKLFDSVTQPGAILTIVFWGMAVGAVIARWKKINGLERLALGWFWLTLLPISQIVTTIGVQPGYISCAEHFLYLTCVPVFLVAANILYKYHWSALRISMLGVLIFFAMTTIEQNFYAQSELAMMERSLHYQPHNSRLHSSVGLIHALNGRFVKAEKSFRMAVADDPLNPRYLISLGKSVCDQHRYAECLKIYESIRDPGSYAKILGENKAAAIKLMKESP